MKLDITRDEFIKGTVALASATAPTVFAENPLSAEAKKKRSLGQFFTRGDCWLRPQVKEFIVESGAHVAYDPFAGDGCLLRKVQSDVSEIRETAGLDIDKTLGWKWNDSLENIPHLDGAIIITNPPYISNYSARRKHINESLEKYFRHRRSTTTSTFLRLTRCLPRRNMWLQSFLKHSSTPLTNRSRV